MTMPLVSVVLPVRNGGGYLAGAIDSVLSQTFTDLELIVLDNASSDGSIEALPLSVVTDPRVKILKSDTDLTIETNWARIVPAIERGEICGEFMTLLGHDDILLPNFLELLVALARSAPECALYQSHFIIIDRHGKRLRNCKPVPVRETHMDFFLARAWDVRDSFGTGYLFRTHDYLAANGIPPYPRLLCADDMLWVRLMQNGGKACTPDIGFAYRFHLESASAQATPRKYIDLLSAVGCYLDDLATEFPQVLSSEYPRMSTCRWIERVLLDIRRASLNFGWNIGSGTSEYDALKSRLVELSRDADEQYRTELTWLDRTTRRLLHRPILATTKLLRSIRS